MDSATLDAALAAQRGYFATGATLPLEARRAALRRLYGELQQREGDVALRLSRSSRQNGKKNRWKRRLSRNLRPFSSLRRRRNPSRLVSACRN